MTEPIRCQAAVSPKPARPAGVAGGTRGDVYEGSTRRGARHGQGTVRLADGSEYRGGWRRGRLDGAGAVRDADGSTFEGVFANGAAVIGRQEGPEGVVHGLLRGGLLHGPGLRCYPDGRVMVGTFVAGVHRGPVQRAALVALIGAGAQAVPPGAAAAATPAPRPVPRPAAGVEPPADAGTAAHQRARTALLVAIVAALPDHALEDLLLDSDGDGRNLLHHALARCPPCADALLLRLEALPPGRAAALLRLRDRRGCGPMEVAAGHGPATDEALINVFALVLVHGWLLPSSQRDHMLVRGLRLRDDLSLPLNAADKQTLQMLRGLTEAAGGRPLVVPAEHRHRLRTLVAAVADLEVCPVDQLWDDASVCALRARVCPPPRPGAVAAARAREDRALRLVPLMGAAELAVPRALVTLPPGMSMAVLEAQQVVHSVEVALINGHARLARAIFAACRAHLGVPWLGRMQDVALFVGDRPTFEVLTQAHAVEPFLRTLEAMAAGRSAQPELLS